MFDWEGTLLLDQEDVLPRLSVSRTRRKYNKKAKIGSQLCLLEPRVIIQLQT